MSVHQRGFFQCHIVLFPSPPSTISSTPTLLELLSNIPLFYFNLYHISTKPITSPNHPTPLLMKCSIFDTLPSSIVNDLCCSSCTFLSSEGEFCHKERGSSSTTKTTIIIETSAATNPAAFLSLSHFLHTNT